LTGRDEYAGADYVKGRSATRTRETTMGEFGPWHLLIVVVAFVVLFGANKLPQMARSVGQSMRIFKAETSALSGEKEPEQLSPTIQQPSTAQPPQAHPQEQPPVG
jgi:sec-independent protein translocase protein TatA